MNYEPYATAATPLYPEHIHPRLNAPIGVLCGRCGQMFQRQGDGWYASNAGVLVQHFCSVLNAYEQGCVITPGIAYFPDNEPVGLHPSWTISSGPFGYTITDPQLGAIGVGDVNSRGFRLAIWDAFYSRRGHHDLRSAGQYHVVEVIAPRARRRRRGTVH